MNETRTNRKTYCTFDVGNLHCGIAVDEVQEVIRNQPTTIIPLTPRSIHGLMNLRGQVVVALDIRVCLGLPLAGPDGLMNVVIRTQEEPVSFLVDCIGDVVKLDESQIEPTPETLRESIHVLATGTVQLNDRLLLVLDSNAVINASFAESELTTVTPFDQHVF